jgi:predicted Zn-dependent protease
MEAIQTVEHPTFESVWAALQENAQGMKELRESQKETARQMKETDRQMKETDRQMKETDQILKKNAQQIGKLGLRMGEVVEYLVAPNLREKFRELGYNFPQANPNSNVSDLDNDIFLEIDIKLENGDKAMLVEAKTKPSTEDVKEHIKRLEKMRKYADLHDDKRTFLGAVAGVVMTDNVKEYALKQGFFVIEPSGETFNIIPPNKPKEW